MTRTPLTNLSFGGRSKGKGHHITTAIIKYTTLLEHGRIRLSIPNRQQRVRLVVSCCVRAEWKRG